MRLGGYGYLSLQDTRDDETGRRWADACSVSPIQEATVAASPAAGTGRSPRRPLRPPRPPSVVLVHRPVEAEAESEPEGEKAGAGGLGNGRGWAPRGGAPRGWGGARSKDWAQSTRHGDCSRGDIPVRVPSWLRLLWETLGSALSLQRHADRHAHGRAFLLSQLLHLRSQGRPQLPAQLPKGECCLQGLLEETGSQQVNGHPTRERLTLPMKSWCLP